MSISSIRKEYQEIESRAIRVKDALSSELVHLFSKNKVTLGVPIESRVKSWESIEEKINRKLLIIKNVVDVDDLVGLRIILLFRRDLIAVDELLRNSLTVLSMEDTSLRLDEAHFGYQSQHYVVEFPKEWLNIPSYGDFGGIRVEIQVRTLAQHIWAAASHKLQYKHEASVPLPLRRAIHRASALLETVDLEFDRLLEDRSQYVKDQLNSTNPDELLNVELLKALLSELLPAENKNDDEPYDDLMIDLNHFKVNTVAKLRAMLIKHSKKILKAELAEADERKMSHYFMHVGLVREGLRAEFGSNVVSDFLRSRTDDNIFRVLGS